MAPTERFQPLLKPDPVNPYLNLYKASCFVESSHRAKVINEEEQAYGIVMIRQCKLDDFNKATGKKYVLTDCFNTSISKEIFMQHCDIYGPYNLEKCSRTWNGGPNGMKYKETEEYYLKIQKVLLSL
jgi:hypothetical protein